MKKAVVMAALVVMLLPVAPLASDRRDSDDATDAVRAHSDGYQVVPSQNSAGSSRFHARVDRHAKTIEYELSWQDLKGDILQSHIHFGRRATNGDIVAFLCTNLGNTPPSATPAPTCQGPREGMVHGVLRAGDIVALAFAGIQPAQQLLPFSDFDEFANAIEAGATYVVVHTKAQPPGELRGQIHGREHHAHH